MERWIDPNNTTAKNSAATSVRCARLQRGSATIRHASQETASLPPHRVGVKHLSSGTDSASQVDDQHERCVHIDELIELKVGGEEAEVDPLALERTERFQADRSARESVSRLQSSPRSTDAHLCLTLVLIGSLPAPPSKSATEERSSSKAAPLPRESLRLRVHDESVLGLLLAALRAPMDEQQPPSPLGPAAIAGSFGAPLEEAALVDTPVGLLVPAVLEALFLALQKAEDGLDTEGFFRLSASLEEVGGVRGRLQEADRSEAALEAASCHRCP